MKFVNFKNRKPIYSFEIIGIISLILFGLYTFASDQVPSFNLASMATLKVPVSDILEPEQECLEMPDGYKKWSCLVPYFEKLTIVKSERTAVTEALNFKTHGVVSDCHLFAHFIGEKSLEKHNFDMGKAFSSCIFGCSDGCFHGVMERYINEQQILPEIKNICDSVGTDWRRKRMCIHGLGHGLLAHNYLPLEDAINACRTLDDPFWAHQCLGGLMMEQVDQYLSLNLAESDLKKILPEICTPMESTGDSKIMKDCLQHISLGLLYYTGWDAEHSEELCEELMKQEQINDCKNFIPGLIIIEKPSNIDINELLFVLQTEKFCEELSQQEQIDHCKRSIRDTILLEKPLNIDINEVLLNH